MRIILIISALALALSGCKSPPSPVTTSPVQFGEGNSIVESVLQNVLSGYETQFEELSWSGGGSEDEFSVDDLLIVKQAALTEISTKLSHELDKLPAKRAWKKHGFGSSGHTNDSLLEISYEEDNTQFYIDFVLIQQGEDVKMLILHKGIKRN